MLYAMVVGGFGLRWLLVFVTRFFWFKIVFLGGFGGLRVGGFVGLTFCGLWVGVPGWSGVVLVA